VEWSGVEWREREGKRAGRNGRERKKSAKKKNTHTFPLFLSFPHPTQSNSSWAKYLKEGTEVQLVTWNGKVISVDPPTTVELEVASTDPGVKGNTVSGGSKPATLETGAVVQVPLFVNAGEKVKVDTRTDQYLSRAATSSF
jgi:hypothetical protein